MLTVGIDFAAQSRDSALCSLEWNDSTVSVRDLHLGVTDKEIVESIQIADKTGLDVPFGWPAAFAKAVHSWAEGQPWQDAGARLWMRATDVAVQAIKQPLSVSSDRIARTAARAARVLTEVAGAGIAVSRAGVGKVVEVYPAAALRRWGLPCTGYKRTKPACRAVREQILASLIVKASPRISDEHRKLCVSHDHALDALVAALVARAHAVGFCDPIPEDSLAAAQIEGWIALPQAECLARLSLSPGAPVQAVGAL